jgi:hypothetical protein
MSETEVVELPCGCVLEPCGFTMPWLRIDGQFYRHVRECTQVAGFSDFQKNHHALVARAIERQGAESKGREQ